MKLLSCHIENFGKMHNCSFDLREGLNVFCEENGWGKSTFAHFILAMFYGLEGDRKRKISENERKKFYPWQGGVFGGQLLFETKGKQYQISRIFRDKEANDEFELRNVKTNLLSEDYSEKIGEELFKIDRNSFMRSVFIAQNDCESVATDSINAKIGNLTDNTDDINSYETAVQRITDLLNGMSPSRKTGSIAKREVLITSLRRKVQESSSISESIKLCQQRLEKEYEDYEKLKKEEKKTRRMQAEAASLKESENRRNERRRLIREYESAVRSEESQRKYFSGEVPELNELDVMIGTAHEMESYEQKCEFYRFTVAEKKEYDELAEIFKDHAPSEDEMDEMLEETLLYIQRRQELLRGCLSAEEERRRKELQKVFDTDQFSVAEMSAKWNERNNKRASLESKEAAAEVLKTSAPDGKVRRRKSSFAIITGCICLIIGIFIFITSLKRENIVSVFGVGLLISGIVVVTLGILNSKRKETSLEKKRSSRIAQICDEINEDRRFIIVTDLVMKAYIEKHGRTFFADENSVSSVLQEIIWESIELQALNEKIKKISVCESEELDVQRKNICMFLNKYGEKGNEEMVLDEMYNIRQKVSRFKDLSQKHHSYIEEEKNYDGRYRVIEEYLFDYKICPEKPIEKQMLLIRDHVISYMNASTVREHAEERLTRFEKEQRGKTDNMAETSSADSNMQSMEEINEKLNLLTSKREKIHAKILESMRETEELQEKYDILEEDKAFLKEQEQLQINEKNKYKTLQDVKLMLRNARDTLTAKYSKTVRKSFDDYYSLIADERSDMFRIDANSQVTSYDHGKQRTLETKSIGYQDLIGICLRIALVDAMYKNESPVLVMDDPFTNLDDFKMERAKVFLKKISQKYQIIYFTCSDARSI